MIPKKIHYCWFGNNPKSKLILDCIQSWKIFCPDFEIIEWNETNSKQYSNSFYDNALRKKKFAFAADYIRSKVVFELGGIYLDTDMLLLKSIDNLLQYNFVIGEEVEGRINFALFGSEKKHRFLGEMIKFYDATEFNVFSPPVITHTFSPLISRATIKEKEEIVSSDFFYPLPYENRAENFSKFITENSLAVHLWDHSWKGTSQENLKTLFNNWISVVVDFLFYNYSHAYFRRYFKEFSRKIYHKIKSKF